MSGADRENAVVAVCSGRVKRGCLWACSTAGVIPKRRARKVT